MQQSVLQHSKKSFNVKSQLQKLFKVIFIGHSTVGKTSIIKRYIKNEFAMKQLNTVGVDCESKIVIIDKQSIKLQCVHIAGQERFRSLTRNYYRGCDAVVIVYDICSKESFDALNGWIGDFDRQSQREIYNSKCDNKSIQKLLLANKCDNIRNRVITEEQGKNFAHAMDCLFFETSAKEGTNIEEAFQNLLFKLLEGKHDIQENIQKAQLRNSFCLEAEQQQQLAKSNSDVRLIKSQFGRTQQTDLSPMNSGISMIKSVNQFNKQIILHNLTAEAHSDTKLPEFGGSKETQDKSDYETTIKPRQSIKLLHPRNTFNPRNSSKVIQEAIKYTESPCYQRYFYLLQYKLLLFMIITLFFLKIIFIFYIMTKKSQQIDMKLITNDEEIAKIDNINYSQLQGHQPPANTPMTPGPKSQWNNVVIDDSCQLSWNQDNYSFQYHAQEIQAPINTLNTYSRTLLKEMMKLDFGGTQKVSRIAQLQFRQCVQVLNQSEYFKRLNPSYIQEPQHSPLKKQQNKQQPQHYLVRQVDDPFVKQKRDEMREQQKWFEIQSQIGTKDIQFTKDLKFKLNQLAPQNYKQISQQVIDLVMKDTDLQTSALIQILEKGAIEDKYRNIYAQLVQQILNKVQNTSQTKSTIKSLLLNLLSPPDYDKINEEVKCLNDNDKLIYQTKRKKKFIGYNKLIATLFKESVYPQQFVDEAFCINTQCFVTQNNIKEKTPDQKRISEEPIEAIMALLQVCGRDYISQESSADWNGFLDSLSRNQSPKEVVHFSQKGLIQLYQISSYQSIDCLMNNYPMSQRVSILLQNLREEINNKFSGQSKKIKKNNVDSSDDEDYTLESTKLAKQNKQQPSLKHIAEDEDDQLLSSKKPLTDKDIILILDQCFKSSVDILPLLQTKLLNRITNDTHWALFWKIFLTNLLDISPANMLRVQIPYKIFEPYQDFCSSEIVMMELNEVLQDKIFDIVESPYGLEFLGKLMRPFIIHNFGSILQIKLDEQQEELQQFYIQLMGRIINQEQLQSDTNINTISQFFVVNLMLSVEQQQMMWESIK